MVFQRKYATLLVTGTTAIRVPIIKRAVVDFAVSADWTPSAGDVKILIDGAGAANVTNLPTAVATANTGTVWEFILTAAELTGKNIQVVISDAATKAIEDQCFIVETFGNASAMYPYNLGAADLGLLDLINTGATHNINNSVGKQIRLAAGNVPLAIRSGTAQSGSTSNTIKLDAGASATNNIYVGGLLVIDGGTGIQQTRTIIGYVGATKIATVNANWLITPDGTSTFTIYASANSIVSREGTAQAGGASTITLDAGASATDHYYEESFVTILSGTGSGQTRVITGYVGATKVATVDSAWSVQPDSTSVFAVIPAGLVAADQAVAPSVGDITAGLLNAQVPTSNTVHTVADALNAARAQGFGKWAIVGTTLSLYASDGTTVVKSFTLDSATAPTART